MHQLCFRSANVRYGGNSILPGHYIVVFVVHNAKFCNVVNTKTFQLRKILLDQTFASLFIFNMSQKLFRCLFFFPVHLVE